MVFYARQKEMLFKKETNDTESRVVTERESMLGNKCVRSLAEKEREVLEWL